MKTLSDYELAYVSGGNALDTVTGSFVDEVGSDSNTGVAMLNAIDLAMTDPVMAAVLFVATLPQLAELVPAGVQGVTTNPMGDPGF